MVKWTEQQKEAIILMNTEILVSAAAGSGKTATLIERVINILSDESLSVRCENILITTFTNAAAGEIRERIRNSLRDKVQSDSSNLYIYKQYKSISRATISTLHAFCSEIIRKNASLINLDPGFSVTDEAVADKYLLQAINNVFEKYLDNKDSSFIKLLSTFGYGKNFNALTDLIVSVLKTVKSYPNYENWLNEATEKTLINEDIFSSDYGKQIKNYVRGCLAACEKYIEFLEYELSGRYEADYYQTLIEEDSRIIQEISNKLDYTKWDEFKGYIGTIIFTSLPRKKKDFDEETVNKVKEYRERWKKTVKTLSTIFYDNEEGIRIDCLYMYEPIKKFVEVILKADEEYAKIKEKAKLIDYADMEHMALKCLKAGADQIYKDKFKHILIDEYQDFNYIQEEIISSISNNNVFAVGDLKQSIYRFRNAQTSIFRNKSIKFQNNPKDGKKLNLSYNFRSREIILNYINSIFSNIMSEKAGEVCYGDEEKLRFGAKHYDTETKDRNYLPSVIKIHFNRPETDFKSEWTKIEIEAYIVANEIKKLLKSGLNVFDNKSNALRPVRESDIVILMRSANQYAEKYCEILSKCGVANYSEQSIEFLSSKTISDLYALLNIVDNPYQDIYLVQIMKNKVYSFNEAEFAIVKKAKSSLYDALLSYEGNENLKYKIKRFLDDIDDIRTFSKTNTVEKTVYYAMTKSGIYYMSEDQDLLKRFYVLSVECYKKGIDDLCSFISFLKSKDKKDLSVIYNILSTDEGNAVRIMSIHKSKGLEFPVVILAGCSRKFNNEDSRKRLIIDKNLGIGSDYINSENKTYHKHITKNALSISIKKQNLSEEMRILYVALTRAKEKLIVTGIDKEFAKNVVVEDASCYFDWILENTDESLIHTVDEFESDEIIKNLAKTDNMKSNSHKWSDDVAFYQKIMEKISFRYPFIEETRLNRKVSVTELTKYKSKNYSIEEFYNQYHVESVKKPLFMSKDSISANAAHRGTLMHKIMASIDLKKLNDPQYIFYIKSKITEPEYMNNITAFISSPIYNDICEADEIYQEKVFFLPVNTSYISSLTGQIFEVDHEVLLQGVIDCLIIKDGYGTILDYKTDKVKKGNEKEHSLKYKRQLEIYANAVEKIMGIKIKGKVIHFFETNTNVNLNLL